MRPVQLIGSILKAAAACGIVAATASSVRADVVIGSFDSTHSQRPFLGNDYSDIRTDLATNFFPTTGQTVSFAPAITTATSSDLSGDNVFVLGEVSQLDPLSSDEVTALKDFVLGGNKLVLISDTAAFGQYGSNQILSALSEGSIGGHAGTVGGNAIGSIVGSGTATAGPFGTLDAKSTFASYISANVTPGAQVNVLGTATDPTYGAYNLLAEIPADALGSGSGAALIVSSAIFQNAYVPNNDNNRILFENFLVPEPASLSLLSLGAVGLLSRRRA